MNSEDLVKVLTGKQLIETSDSSFMFYRLLPEQLRDFAFVLSELSDEEFNQMWNSFGELRARSISYNPDFILNHPKINPYNAWEEIKTFIAGYPLIGLKLINYLADFKSEKDILSYRDRHYGIFNSNSFEEGVENALSRFRHESGESIKAKYGLSYAGEIIADKFPEDGVILMKKLLETLKAEGWNEGDEKVCAKMTILSILVYRFFDHVNCSKQSLQSILLSSDCMEIRAASAAAVLSVILYDEHHKPDIPGMLSLLEDKLPDIEYRIALAQLISECEIKFKNKKGQDLQESLFARLKNKWPGTPDDVKRIVKVLNGRLQANHSFSITEKFLKPLVKAGHIDKHFSLALWQDVLLNKIKFREVYQSGSSDTIGDRFSINTDQELTKTIINQVGEAEAAEQEKIIKEWIYVINSIWKVLNQPYARHAYYSTYSESASRVYWVYFLIDSLLKQQLLSGLPLTLAKDFMKKREKEFESIVKFIESRGFTEVGQLKQVTTDYFFVS